MLHHYWPFSAQSLPVQPAISCLSAKTHFSLSPLSFLPRLHRSTWMPEKANIYFFRPLLPAQGIMTSFVGQINCIHPSFSPLTVSLLFSSKCCSLCVSESMSQLKSIVCHRSYFLSRKYTAGQFHPFYFRDLQGSVVNRMNLLSFLMS